MILTVRSAKEVDSKAKSHNWKQYGDGWLTSKGTFQKGFTQPQLEALARRTGFKATWNLKRNPVMLVASKRIL